VARFGLVQPSARHPALSSGDVGIDIVRYEAPGRPGPPDNAHYVMGLNAEGRHLWDDWYESEAAAREAIDDGEYGAVVDRTSDAR